MKLVETYHFEYQSFAIYRLDPVVDSNTGDLVDKTDYPYLLTHAPYREDFLKTVTDDWLIENDIDITKGDSLCKTLEEAELKAQLYRAMFTFHLLKTYEASLDDISELRIRIAKPQFGGDYLKISEYYWQGDEKKEFFGWKTAKEYEEDQRKLNEEIKDFWKGEGRAYISQDDGVQ